MLKLINAFLGLFFPRDAQAYAEKQADQSGEDLSVHESVVDLLKALGQDSTYGARAKLAADFGRPDYAGTAEQNTWLHQEIMRRVSQRRFP